MNSLDKIGTVWILFTKKWPPNGGFIQIMLTKAMEMVGNQKVWRESKDFLRSLSETYSEQFKTTSASFFAKAKKYVNALQLHFIPVKVIQTQRRQLSLYGHFDKDY